MPQLTQLWNNSRLHDMNLCILLLQKLSTKLNIWIGKWALLIARPKGCPKNRTLIQDLHTLGHFQISLSSFGFVWHFLELLDALFCTFLPGNLCNWVGHYKLFCKGALCCHFITSKQYFSSETQTPIMLQPVLKKALVRNIFFNRIYL